MSADEAKEYGLVDQVIANGPDAVGPSAQPEQVPFRGQAPFSFGYHRSNISVRRHAAMAEKRHDQRKDPVLLLLRQEPA